MPRRGRGHPQDPMINSCGNQHTMTKFATTNTGVTSNSVNRPLPMSPFMNCGTAVVTPPTAELTPASRGRLLVMAKTATGNVLDPTSPLCCPSSTRLLSFSQIL